MEVNSSTPGSTTTTYTIGTNSSSVASSRSSPPKLLLSSPHLSEGASRIVKDLSNYLALGCIYLENSDAAQEVQAQAWDDTDTLPIPANGFTELHTCLARLLRYGWVRLQHSRCRSNSIFSIFRVYLLYSDKGLAFIERNNKTLLSAVEVVLASVSTDSGPWNGVYENDRTSSFDMWAKRDEEDSSLFYIFNKLASPAPDAQDIDERYAREALEDLLDLNHAVAGLRTSLHPYQRRSAGAMMHRELAPKSKLDVRLEERRAVDGSTFYFSPREMKFFKEQKFQEAPSGGILAETMGYGKTLICLALVVATRHHAPQMPAEYATIPVRSRTGSLADMAVATINRKSVPYKVELDRLREAGGAELSSTCQHMLRSAPPAYNIPVEPIRWNRNTIVQAPRHVVMASTTIIVVPQNLCKQWVSEIQKHVVPGLLKVLVMDDRKQPLPGAKDLVLYDVVLFTRNRFDMEFQDGQDRDGRRMPKNHNTCQCTYIGATRTRDCHCLSANDLYSSPLKDVHFKRLIVDEGHFFSSGSSSRTMLVVDRLVKTESRWVVSGTPAKELLGVEVDLQLPDADRGAVLDLRRSFDPKLDRSGAIDSLSALASTFLRATPWSAAEAKNYLYRHEDRRERTYSGFSVCLRRLLEQIVVKTRPEDYERDVELPPLRHDIITLQPSFYDKITANLFTLVLTANAVTSERTDADYLFHKNSTKARLQLVANLRQSAFFWSGFSEADVHASVKTSRDYLAKDDTGCSIEDQALLTEALRCTECILASKGWASMSRSHELGVYVQDWPADSSEHWTFDGLTSPVLTGISQLLEAQRFVNERLAQDDPGEGLSGVGIKSLATVRQSIAADATEPVSAKPLLSKTGVPTSSIHGEPLLLRRGSHSASRKSRSPRGSMSRHFRVTKPLGKTKTKCRQSPEVLKSMRISLEAQSEAESFVREQQPPLVERSPYLQARIVGTTSAKLSYLISKILQYQDSEKILVFYSGDNSAFYISQFLELFHVKHEIYAKSLSAKLKSEYVVRFQEDGGLRVLLMDVGQAAYGLNLCAASRVWFVNPVCKPDVEAQALKRAHRIGQTRPVMCETLVLAGSIEEAMLERSQQMTKAEHLDAKVLEDDGGIRAIIQGARLLALSEEEMQPGLGQMARLEKTEPLWCRPGWQTFGTTERPVRQRKEMTLVDVTNPGEPERMIVDED
ncbi:Putative helicase, P-loop containing nucleoside triphosphate hydrolase [Septoria linicola]|uniref:Helicase, P-loop containing nucleoside triphosphate hydrolase n=1 Tax=Septoria linicola TaxID=215465 RepID=A0A9Q9AL28_9PEZI|nr:putative helicase, P-loop containing nucleoside triphosphate hydrolase [Septoria linicola]USW47931.1 Putative helicase, P-loop containing nucleoside triphosphate hydrolase [Septoria linicola]